MAVKKTLISLSITTLVLGGAWNAAMAKTDEEDSVYRWGRWAVLAPAAGEQPVLAVAPVPAGDLGRCESGQNCPSPIPAPQDQPIPDQPEEPEEPRASEGVGYARVDVRNRGESRENMDYVASFALNMDRSAGTVSFGVGAGTLLDPDTKEGIDSDTQAATYSEASVTTSGDRRATTVVRGTSDAGNIDQVAHGFWQYGADSGEFAWGMTATDADILRIADELGGDRSARYEGFTMNGGTADLRIDFGNATWSAYFNGGISFDVENGQLTGATLSTDETTQFSDNIAFGTVEGALVNAGNNVIGGYEVVDLDGNLDADVFNAARTDNAPTLQ